MKHVAMLGALLIALLGSLRAEAARVEVSRDYSTIQEAVDAAGSGDTVQVAPEAYLGNPTPLKVPEDYSTIQEAVDAAGSGDTVLVAPGAYPEFVTLKGGVRLHVETPTEALDVVIDASGLIAPGPIDYVVGWEATTDRIEIVGFTLVDDHGPESAGILVRGANHLIEGNTIRGEFTYGIQLEGDQANWDMSDDWTYFNTVAGNRVFIEDIPNNPPRPKAISVVNGAYNRFQNNLLRGGWNGFYLKNSWLNVLGGNACIGSRGNAPGGGVGIWIEDGGQNYVVNNTALGYGAEQTAGLRAASTNGLIVHNSILKGSGRGLHSYSSSGIVVTHSLLKGGSPDWHFDGPGITIGEGVLIGVDPRLVASSLNFRLLANSPARDAGLGEDRDGTQADMGAYGGVF